MHSNQSIDPTLGKAEKYEQLLPQMKALLEGETHRVANMANFVALLHTTFDWHWTGFYLVSDEDDLVLGPFQGPVACTRLRRGKGVCAAAWESGQTVVVDDVDAFPGHVACSSLSRSEIVVPVRDNSGAVTAVLDVDSVKLADFDEVDRAGLQALIQVLEESL